MKYPVEVTPLPSCYYHSYHLKIVPFGFHVLCVCAVNLKAVAKKSLGNDLARVQTITKRLLPARCFHREQRIIFSEFEWWKVNAYFDLISWCALLQRGVIWMTSQFCGHSDVIKVRILSQISVAYFSVCKCKIIQILYISLLKGGVTLRSCAREE
jgi:hypothetical protein